jgi:glyceraldehyde 3-phosphate dehydrogenase
VAVIDSLLTETHGPLVRLFLWYDNEWGYTNRLMELMELAGYLR